MDFASFSSSKAFLISPSFNVLRVVLKILIADCIGVWSKISSLLLISSNRHLICASRRPKQSIFIWHSIDDAFCKSSVSQCYSSSIMWSHSVYVSWGQNGDLVTGKLGRAWVSAWFGLNDEVGVWKFLNFHTLTFPLTPIRTKVVSQVFLS